MQDFQQIWEMVVVLITVAFMDLFVCNWMHQSGADQEACGPLIVVYMPQLKSSHLINPSLNKQILNKRNIKLNVLYISSIITEIPQEHIKNIIF